MRTQTLLLLGLVICAMTVSVNAADPVATETCTGTGEATSLFCAKNLYCGD